MSADRTVFMVQGREVADWISVSAFLAGRGDEWESVVSVTGPFSVEVNGMAARPGEVIVRELDGSLTVARYGDEALS